jgi:hypothetical protein
VSDVNAVIGGPERITPACSLQPTSPPNGRAFVTIRESAALLGVSESWVRRHVRELPIVRIGRLLRIDSALLLRQFQGKYRSGIRLKPEGEKQMTLQLRRYQRGYVYKTGRKIKTWYGMCREDIPQPDGQIIRRQKNLRLGTMSELPTRSSAYEELSRRMGEKQVSVELTCSGLVDRWKAAIVPTIKTPTATYYLKMLNVHVLPAFGRKEISSMSL